MWDGKQQPPAGVRLPSDNSIMRQLQKPAHDAAFGARRASSDGGGLQIPSSAPFGGVQLVCPTSAAGPAGSGPLSMWMGTSEPSVGLSLSLNPGRNVAPIQTSTVPAGQAGSGAAVADDADTGVSISLGGALGMAGGRAAAVKLAHVGAAAHGGRRMMGAGRADWDEGDEITGEEDALAYAAGLGADGNLWQPLMDDEEGRSPHAVLPPAQLDLTALQIEQGAAGEVAAGGLLLPGQRFDPTMLVPLQGLIGGSSLPMALGSRSFPLSLDAAVSGAGVAGGADMGQQLQEVQQQVALLKQLRQQVEQQVQAQQAQLTQQQVQFTGWANPVQLLQQQQQQVQLQQHMPPPGRPKGTGVFMPLAVQPGSPLQNQQPLSGGSTPLGGMHQPTPSPTAVAAATRAGLATVGQSPTRTGSPEVLPGAAGLDRGASITGGGGAGGRVRQELVTNLCNYLLTALNEEELLVVTATLGKQLNLVG